MAFYVNPGAAIENDPRAKLVRIRSKGTAPNGYSETYNVEHCGDIGETMRQHCAVVASFEKRGFKVERAWVWEL